MTATIIDGRAVADSILSECAAKVAAGGTPPGLAVVIVGENPASKVYVRNKVRACEKVGLESRAHHLPESTAEEELMALLSDLNNDSAIHGILLQLPLPPHIDSEKALLAIAPHKDVDGFHPMNMGRVVSGLPALYPCTPHGCMHLLSHSGIDPAGKQAVIIGRSNIVGKPMALMLINAGATVTVCNSKTPNLPALAKCGDILVAAAGRANMVDATYIKPGAAVIDVGINRTDDGIVGDVDFESARQTAGYITPVPGGVGPMTIAMLVANTLQAARG